MRTLSAPAYAADNVGKHSVVLDLKDEEGLQGLHAILSTADVFISNFRTQALERLGMAPEQLAPRYPRLVIATLTAYGTDGPDKDRPGYDLAAFYARSGMAMAYVPEGGMPQENAGPGVGDHSTGTAFAGAVAAALFKRERHPEKLGGTVSTSLLRFGVYAHSGDTNRHLSALATGTPVARPPEPMPDGQGIYSGNPLSRPYRVAEGGVVVLLGMESQRHMPAIFTALGHPEWMEDERFNTLMARLKNRHVLTGLMAEILLGKTLEEWEPIFAEHDVWHEKVQRTVTAVEDPQLIAAGCFTPIPAHPDAPADEPAMQVVNTAFDFDDRLTTVGGPTAALGEHTAEALASAGVKPAAIERLVSRL
eukprot:COSAG04_NODE_460_length_13977_cov_5.936662_10_plen_364_part_00